MGIKILPLFYCSDIKELLLNIFHGGLPSELLPNCYHVWGNERVCKRVVDLPVPPPNLIPHLFRVRSGRVSYMLLGL